MNTQSIDKTKKNFHSDNHIKIKADLTFINKIKTIEDLENHLMFDKHISLEPSLILFNEIKKQKTYKIRDKFNKTLLFKRYIWKPAFIKHLLIHDIDINHQDIHGKTAIFYCEDLKPFKYMIAKGANIDHRDMNGCSALFYPIYSKKKSVIKEILKISNLNIEDNEGLNFLSYDFPYKYTDLVIKNKDRIKNKSIEIKCIYLNFVNTWDLLIKHEFKAKIGNKVVLEYDPYTSKDTLRKLVEMFDNKKVSINKDTMFYIHEKFKTSNDPKYFFTLNELHGIVNK
ncbi:hypothetical protein [Pectobacterium aroidearum]|uniref:hypothetical protein n=1 Tax=Pectobacterium aroidearum TaxID=1201031 RepID=UPI0033075AAD